MSKWDKLLARICGLSRDLRFDELRKVLESYGYEMRQPNGGSSHYTFRKPGCANYDSHARTDQESLCYDGKRGCRKRGVES